MTWTEDRLAIFDGLARSSLTGDSYELLFADFCSSISASGIAVARAHFSTATLHPLINAVGVTWLPGIGASRENFEHRGTHKPVWRESPFFFMLEEGLSELHCPLVGNLSRRDFPVFNTFRASGLTDWIAFLIDFGWSADHLPTGSLGMIASWATRAPDGFSEGDVERLRSVCPALAAAIKSRVFQDLSRDVISAYLGADAAGKVMGGAITRGSVTDISAAIMMADIRDFTGLSEAMSRTDLVALLNRTFDAAAVPIVEAGGQILKFMGDGFLAIFQAEDDRVAAVQSALAAALAVQDRLPAGVRMDIALHVGDVHYGNIGAADRLDFTVIGSAVNEAARIEGLCSRIGRPVLVSHEFALLAGLDGFDALGAFSHKGLAELRLVYAPKTPSPR